MKIPAFLFLIGCSVCGVACDKGEDQAELAREVAEKTAAAQREMDEAKAKAAQEIAEVERKAEEAKREARAEIQKDVAAIDRKAMSLKESLATAAGKAKENAAAAAAEFDKRRGVLEGDLQKLNTATGAAWDTVKAETKLHLDAARDGLDSFDKTLAAKK